LQERTRRPVEEGEYVGTGVGLGSRGGEVVYDEVERGELKEGGEES